MEIEKYRMNHVDMELKKVKGLLQWKRIYDLYQKAFPPSEKKPFGMIYQKWKQGYTDVWYLEEKGKFAGLAITMNARDMVLLDYFAIAEKLRGKGIGSKALEVLRQIYEGKRLFLEIESVYEECPDLEVRKRRKRFYLANGLTPMEIRVNLFGVNMELLGFDCMVDFESYHSIYTGIYGEKLGKMIKKGSI